jgi:CDP-diacylglycerol---glycerol-3-phosphate 3-phosphatidyltransferase
MAKLDTNRKSIAVRITEPVVKFISKTPLTPNMVTVIGFAITVAAGALAFAEHLLTAGFVALLAGVFDMLDGALARTTKRVTKFGAILDSTLDRASEALILIGLLAVFVRAGNLTESMLVGFALTGSFLTSYTRARMEGLGIECKAGLFTRTERVIVTAAGLILSGISHVLLIALIIVTIFSWYTTIERMVYAWRNLKNQG